MVADFHARALAGVTGAKLLGVAGRTPDKTRAFATKHGVPFVGATIEELVARPEIQVVGITSSAGAHLAPALAAIRAGKHLVIEKPLEITLARTDEILRAAATAGTMVAPIFQGRFGDGARTVKAALAAGRLGRLVLATAEIKWHRAPAYYTGTRGSLAADGGGVLMAQAIHSLDLLQWLAGLPEEVFCRSTRRVYGHIETEDTAVATLRFPGGALGTVSASTALWPGWRRRIEISGETGSISLEDDHICKWEFREAQPGDDAVRATPDAAALGTGSSAPNAISVTGHQRQLQDFTDALRLGRAPALDGAEGRKAVALVEALYASAAAGLPVRL